MMKVAEWYTNFLKFSDVNFILLTNSQKAFKEAKVRKIQAMTVMDFVQMKCGRYPDLVDFLGATDILNEDQLQNQKSE